MRMLKTRGMGAVVSGTLALLAASCVVAPSGTQPDVELIRQAGAVFGALPSEVASEANPVTEAKVKLGRMLYYDTRLSKSQQFSCNSCHQLDNFGVDGEPTSPGHGDARGNRNSPTVYNAALHLAQFWDGREPDVEAQAKGPILNPVEMAMPSEEAVVALLKTVPGYPPLFAEAFPGEDDPVSYDNLARAIGAFERRLLTPAPIDRFAAGDGDGSTLSEAQKRGLRSFLEIGCQTCHLGAAIGGGQYQKLGLIHPYETADRGRAALTGNEAELHVFKVPSLRNVEKTGPWFHDGSLTSLAEAVRVMAWHQRGVELSEGQIEEIVSFLGALTGEVDADYVAVPELPASSAETPGPDPS